MASLENLAEIVGKNVTVKRVTVLDWEVSIDGAYKGGIHKCNTSRGVYFCHDLFIKRGARFPTFQRALTDLINRAA